MDLNEFRNKHKHLPENAFSGYYEVTLLDSVKQIVISVGMCNTQKEAIELAETYNRLCYGVSLYITYHNYIVN